MPYQNSSQSQSPIKTLRIIFMGLLAGMCAFLIVVLAITPAKGVSFNTADPFVIVAPLMAVMAIFVGPILSGKTLIGAANKTTVREKLMVFQAAFIQRSALLQGSGLLCIVAYMQSGNLLYVIIVCLLVGVFLTNYPTNDKVVTALGISTSDLEAEM